MSKYKSIVDQFQAPFINYWFSLQSCQRLTDSIIWNADDSQGRMYAQRQLHRSPHNLLHARPPANGARASSADAGRVEQCRKRTAHSQSGSRQESSWSDESRDAQVLPWNHPHRAHREVCGCQSIEGDHEDGRGLDQE